MPELTMQIAGFPIGVQCRFESTGEYFKKYLSDCAPAVTVEVLPEDLSAEQHLLNLEADAEGLKRRKFTDPFLERSVIQRKAAGFLLSQNILLLHGSTVAVDGRAYLFTAACGVGKSTHTRLWREVFGERAVMVNDDRAFLKSTPDGVLAYGSPWSGKHGLDSNICCPLAGICILQRGRENTIGKASLEDALPFLLGQAYLPKEAQKETLYALTDAFARQIPIWRMSCTREPEAAKVAFNAMSK